MIAYELLMKETTRESAINEMEQMLFHWYLIMHDFDALFLIHYCGILLHCGLL